MDGELAPGSVDALLLQLFSSRGRGLTRHTAQPSPPYASHKAAVAQQHLNEVGQGSLPLCLIPLCSGPQMKVGTSIHTKQAVSLSPENRGK